MSQVTAENPASGVPARSYWAESSQPIYSAALILPFALAYEAGILLLRSDLINGGDAIVRSLLGRFLNLAGVHVAGGISIVVLAALFIGAQIYKKGSWRIQPPVLMAAFFESLLYAAVLFALLHYAVQYLPGAHERNVRAEAALLSRAGPPDTSGAPGAGVRGEKLKINRDLAACARGGASGPKPGLKEFVLYCGAGVYEELVFRVFLIGLLMLVFTKLFHLEHAYAAVWSVILGAVIFSAFHHIGAGDKFETGIFLQRVLAGLFFAALYINRSFGVAAAAHALYDILIGLSAWWM